MLPVGQKVLLEPVVCVGLVIERGDLDVPG